MEMVKGMVTTVSASAGLKSLVIFDIAFAMN